MKHILLLSTFMFFCVIMVAQNNSYIPAEDVIESSLFCLSENGKTSPFFITSNIKKDSSQFIDLVFTHEIPMPLQMEELKNGLFKSAIKSMDAGKLEYLYIRRLVNTGEFSMNINKMYFEKYKTNAVDSLNERIQTFIHNSILKKELLSILNENGMELIRTIVKEARIIPALQGENIGQIDAQIYFYIRQNNSIGDSSL